MQPSPRSVLDTNVFVSGATIAENNPLSPSQRIIAAWRSRTIEIVTSPSILTELERVLHYDKVRKFIRMRDSEIRQYVAELANGATVISGTTPVKISEDPDDDKFFACALEAQADYIISGDEQHVLAVGSYKGIKTISPRDFVDTVLEPLQKAA